MGTTRNVAVLVWPGLAATAIVGVLLLHQPFREALQPITGWRHVTIIGHGPVSTQPRLRPRTLAAPPMVAEGLERVEAAAAAAAHRRPVGTAYQDPSAGARIVQAPPVPAGVRLHAPLRDDRAELAGWEAAADIDDAPDAFSVSMAATRDAAVLRLAGQRSEPHAPAASGDQPQASAAVAAAQRLAVGQGNGAWPATPALDVLLEKTARNAAALAWTVRVTTALQRLQRLPSVGAAEAGPILDELAMLADTGLAQAETLLDRDAQMHWLRAAHGLQRRCAVWQPLWQTVRDPHIQLTSVAPPADLVGQQQRLPELTDAVRQAAIGTGDAEGWVQYLMLDVVDASSDEQDVSQRQRCAQRFLSRLQWEGLQQPQRQWLGHAAVQRLAAALRPWATGPVDYSKLLQQLERQESDAIDLVGIDVAATLQTLRFADRRPPQAVAQAINAHYRNANLRLAVSQQLLSRLLPEIPDRNVPVRQTLLGTRIAGSSKVATRLDLRLIPSDNSWSIQLLTLGDIQASTVGRQGPVSIRSGSQAQFTAMTPLRITPAAITVGDAEVQVQQQTRLRGLTTEYDGFPLVGSLVRAIATSQYEQSSGEAQRISRGRTQTQIEEQIGGAIEQQIDAVSGRLSERLLGPLGQLQLDPLVVDLRTDQQRLSARYRLAGDWQLAAFTPRPRAPSDSLLSLQVHQSALNNTFERLAPSDEPRAVRAVAAEIVEMFGRDAQSLPDDLPNDVRVQFARTRPVTVEIDDNLMWVTFRVVRLVGDGGLDLRHFIVRAAYRGEVQGTQARLVRDGHLRVTAATMSMRDRIPVRAIFTKILSESRPISLVSSQWTDHPASADMTISQLELRSGWIALAFSPGGGTLAAKADRPLH